MRRPWPLSQNAENKFAAMIDFAFWPRRRCFIAEGMHAGVFCAVTVTDGQQRKNCNEHYGYNSRPFSNGNNCHLFNAYQKRHLLLCIKKACEP
jgi:hypothetical protein